jgi:hypothetical protein
MPASVEFTLMLGLLTLVVVTAKISLKLMAPLNNETRAPEPAVAESEREIR